MTDEKVRTLLLVDDEEDLVTALKARFEACGYAVLIAEDGLDALKMARTHHPDLILLDLMLPKMDGYKVSRLLKFDNRYADIPIIIISARGLELDQEMGRKSGADDYMVKPFDSSDLLARVKKLIEKKEKSKRK